VTSSGTYVQNPSYGQFVAYAYGKCGVRRTELLAEHFEDARMAMNVVLMDFSNKGVNLWKVEKVTTSLVQGQATYSVDPSIVVILDAYISVPNGINGGTTDRLILPVSRSEYSSYPNKSQQGIVTTFWNDRLLSPTVTLYLVPDGTQPTMSYYAVQQIQDAAFTSGQTADLPALFFKAFSDALAAELSTSWAPERYPMLSAIAKESYMTAADQNEEISSVYLSPLVSGYWR